MQDQYSRTQLLLGKEAMEKLHNSRVAVFGIGGVGGYTVEALARSGVGALDLIDDERKWAQTETDPKVGRQRLENDSIRRKCVDNIQIWCI